MQVSNKCQLQENLIHLSFAGIHLLLQTKAIRRFVITEKAPTRAFSWLKAPTTAFTIKTLLRHYAKQVRAGAEPGHRQRAAVQAQVLGQADGEGAGLLPQDARLVL